MKMNRHITHEEYVSRLHTVRPRINPIEKYKGNSVYIKHFCEECNKEIFMSPNKLLNGRHKCNPKIRAFDDYEIQLRAIDSLNHISVIEYNGVNDIKGYTFTIYPNNVT